MFTFYWHPQFQGPVSKYILRQETILALTVLSQKPATLLLRRRNCQNPVKWGLDVNTCPNHMHFGIHLFFFFFWERWCNEGREASWLYLDLDFFGITYTPCPLSFSLLPEFNISLCGFFFFSLLLLGNYWPRSSVHANSLRLVSSILSVDLVVVLSSLQGWVKRTVFATEGFCFCEGFLLRYPPLRGPFADGHYLRELWPAIVFPGSGWQRIELKWDLYSNRQTWEWIYGLLGTDFSKQISV